MAGNRSCLGNELFEQLLYLPSVTYPTLAASASASNTVTIAGALPGDLFSYNMQSPPAHLVIENMYVSAANTVTILWSTDATGISTGTVAVLVGLARWENSSLGITALPSNLS
jgi:hypothetical protein